MRELTHSADKPPLLVIACGALAREVHALKQLNGWSHIKLNCLPAELHFQPERIAGQLRERIAQYREQYDQIFVAYADCGSYGAIDRVLEEYGLERLPGEHCYATFAGQQSFAALAEQEPGTFYLTDFLARHFDRFVIRGLKLDQHPELRGLFFANYQRVVYLDQAQDARALRAARAAADYLQLELTHIVTGYSELRDELEVRVNTSAQPVNVEVAQTERATTEQVA